MIEMVFDRGVLLFFVVYYTIDLYHNIFLFLFFFKHVR